MATKRVLNKRSVVLENNSPKLPGADTMEYGEIAINYAKDNETISIKNNNNEIVTFSSNNNKNKTIFFRGTCNTGESVLDKVVNCPEFKSNDLIDGTAIIVSFSSANTATPTSALTLNVNGTGAIPIKKVYKEALESLTSAGEIRNIPYIFIYDSSSNCWVCNGLNYDSDIPDIITTVSEFSALTQSGSLADALVLKDVIEENELITATALNDLNDRVIELSAATESIDDRVTDLENIESITVITINDNTLSGSNINLGNYLSASTQYISAVTMNNESIQVNNGNVDLGDIITSITINESGVTISGGSVNLGNYIPIEKELTIASAFNDLNDRIVELSARTADTYTKDEIDNTFKIYVKTTLPSTGMLPNTFYDLGTITADTTFNLDTNVDASILNHYYFTFSIGSTIPTLTYPSQITAWFGGRAPVLVANSYYEISIINGKAAYIQI